MSVHLFLNCDEYLASTAIAELRAALSDSPELADLNYVEHEGERLRAVELLAEADMMPFLTERRMIRVNGYFTALSKRLKTRKKGAVEVDGADDSDDEDAVDESPTAARAEAETILRGLADVPETCDLIFFDPVRVTDRGVVNSVELGATSILSKGIKADAAAGVKGAPGLPELEKQGKITLHKLSPINPAPWELEKELAQWVAKHAASRTPKIKIDGDAAALLGKWVGPDLRRLASEMEKLSLYAGNRAITAQDVRLLVADESEEKVWTLTDGLNARDAKKAMGALAILLEEKGMEFMLLASITSNYRQLVRARGLMQRGVKGRDQMAKEMGISPNAAEKAMSNAQRFSNAQLANIFDRLFKANVAMVTGGDQATELELLVADLTLTR